MTRNEAKTVLSAARADGRDAADPLVAEALAFMRLDPELQAWHEREQAFDSLVSTALKSEPVPAGLKDSILADRKVVKVAFPQRRRYYLVAAAAAALLLGGLATWWLNGQTPEFSSFQHELVDSPVNPPAHQRLESSDLKIIRQWLAEQGVKGDWVFPVGLRGDQLTGAQLIDWRGRRIPKLCLKEGGKGNFSSYHLYVFGKDTLTDAPTETGLKLANQGRVNTFGWSHGDRTYVLTGVGMPTDSFVRRFHKGGTQWAWSG